MNDLKQVKPLGKKLLVKLLPLYSSGALLLVDQTKHWDHPTRTGEVLATGPKVRDIVVGDKVLFCGTVGKWVDDPAKVGYETQGLYRSINEDDIMGVFNETSAAV